MDKSPSKPGLVYLLHFDQPVLAVRHYIGFTADLADRTERHEDGFGSKMSREAKKKGVPFIVARTWSGDRKLESRLKKQKNAARLCSVCNPNSTKFKP